MYIPNDIWIYIKSFMFKTPEMKNYDNFIESFNYKINDINNIQFTNEPYSQMMYDSWLTIGITDGDIQNKISAVGIDFNGWDTDNSLRIDNGAIFAMDPDNDIVIDDEYIIGQFTVRTFSNPEIVIKELLRVGKKAIITIPNFGHWKVRLNLLIKGTMPITNSLPNDWYNTPNIHMCTIKDFVKFSKIIGFKIFKSLALENKNISNINRSNLFFKNLFGELGIFLIEK